MNHFEKIESYIPFSLLTFNNMAMAFGVILFFVVFRYFLMVSPFHFIFYVLRPRWSQRRQVYAQLPKKDEQLFEIRWSLVTSLIFAATGVGLGILWQLGWTRIYLRFDEFGWAYFFLSPLIVMVLHDTYFYWAHRWLHLPGPYERYHAIHHASLNPSPWSSFSFHPLEGVVNALAIPLFAMVVPLHPTIILFHLTFMTLSAIINHLGFEVMPASALKQGWGRFLITGTHHSLHHRFFKTNYGLFFTLWDRWLDTEHVRYEKEYEKVFLPRSASISTAVSSSASPT